MTTQVVIKKLNKEIGELKDDVREMKRFLLMPMKDPEGEYKKTFIKKILSRSQNGGQLHAFISKESFLKNVRVKK